MYFIFQGMKIALLSDNSALCNFKALIKYSYARNVNISEAVTHSLWLRLTNSFPFHLVVSCKN